MEIDKKKLPILLITFVAILLAANIFLILTAPKSGETVETDRELVLAKNISKDSHETIQKIVFEAKTLQVNEKVELAREVFNSLNSDLDWIAQKENFYYAKVNSAKSIDTAKDLAAKEVSLLILTNFVITINQESLNELKTASLAELINSANERIEQIKVTDFLAQELLNDENLTQRISAKKIKEQFYNQMAEFLEFKKQSFKIAQTEKEKAIEAAKLISLQKIFEMV